MSEIERAIERFHLYIWSGELLEEDERMYEAVIRVLRAELEREKKTLTCDGCEREEAKKKYMHVICMQCTRMNQTRDRYEPKGEKA